MRTRAPKLLPFLALLVPSSAAGSAPPPAVLFTVSATSAHALWKMKVENTGDVPVRLTADARLLALDVTAPGSKTTVHCSLPAEMRPTNDVDRALILPPKRSYSETFDPRLYCFGNQEAAALVPGAAVAAHLGWPSKPPARTPPFEVSPIEGVEPLVLAMKELSTPPWTIPLDPPRPADTAVVTSPATQGTADAFPVKLRLVSTTRLDVGRAFEIPVTVTVSNEGVRPVTFLFRPETVNFEVLGPQGAEECRWPQHVTAPSRDVLTTLAPKGKAALTVLLTSACTGKTFDQAGLLIVRPHLDTREVGTRELGVHAFEGEIISEKVTVIRLREGRVTPQVTRPQLD
jgi:hypothetical protein